MKTPDTIGTERIETTLFNCRRALKTIHPIMDKDEPCVAYEAYTEAGALLIDLEESSQPADNKSILKNLLAVIHGDGGHYTGRHGIEKSAKDAAKKFYSLQPADTAKRKDNIIPGIHDSHIDGHKIAFDTACPNCGADGYRPEICPQCSYEV